MRLSVAILALALFGPAFGVQDKDSSAGHSIADKTKGLIPRPGLIESFIDAREGKAYLKLGPPDPKTGLIAEFLYIETLTTGLGSNDLGIDRSQFGDTFVLDIREIGGKVLFQVPNLNYRADSGDADAQKANSENFATSIIWGGPVVALDEDGSSLVDITSFLIRDAHGIATALRRSGDFSLNRDRSVLVPDHCKAFPENLEFEALLTYESSKPGELFGTNAPDSRSLTFTQRHSFVKLPDASYKPRRFDPRCGCFSIDYMDFSSPLGQPLWKQWITRHRLEKTDPDAAVSTAKKPIVYYVDRGVPEPIRSALIEGGNYWKRSFRAAGFVDAFKVELMPEGIDPLDVRYNTISWLNRSTRGYAYGQSVIDPRTGEIIKGAVNLDSQRIRQDITLFESLFGVAGEGTGKPNDPIAIALSRIRQLSAHELGHTLGFQHNFAASTYDRASVMDYPAPLINIRNDKLDCSDAYATGTGAWDDQMVRYAYTQFPAGSDWDDRLDAILRDGIKRGLLFLSDQDTSDAEGAEPRANRWDNGKDPVEGLKLSLRVRAIAMKQFGQGNLHTGQPLANLELTFGPLYFFHRYDVDAVAKMVGGFHYVHAVKGDGQVPQWPEPGARQRQALDVLLDCLKPEVLLVPERISRLIGPRPNGSPESAELFSRKASYVFDSLTAASSAADLVISRLLSPARCARILELSMRDVSAPSLDQVLATMGAAIVKTPSGTSRAREVEWSVQHDFVTRLIDLSLSDAGPGVQARAQKALSSIAVAELRMSDIDSSGHAALLAREIHRFLNRPLSGSPTMSGPPAALPGAPIGD